MSEEQIKKRVLEEMGLIKENEFKACAETSIHGTIRLMQEEQKNQLMQRLKAVITSVGSNECPECQRYAELFKDAPHLNITKCPYHLGREEQEKDEAICKCGDHIKGDRGICWICHENDLDNERQKLKAELPEKLDKVVDEIKHERGISPEQDNLDDAVNNASFIEGFNHADEIWRNIILEELKRKLKETIK